MSERKRAAALPDPLVDEVRQRRRELFAACGHDLRRLGEAIQRVEAEHPEMVQDPRSQKHDTAGGLA